MVQTDKSDARSNHASAVAQLLRAPAEDVHPTLYELNFCPRRSTRSEPTSVSASSFLPRLPFQQKEMQRRQLLGRRKENTREVSFMLP